MKLRLLLLSLLAATAIANAADGVRLSGVVTDNSTSEPMSGVVLKIDDGAIWAVTDLAGKYNFASLTSGRYTLTAECLGYVTETIQIQIRQGAVTAFDKNGQPAGLDFSLKVESLALEEVVVTAQRPAGTLGTSHTLDKQALEHLQMSSMSDMVSLLPGGKTVNPDLTQDNAISLRDGGSSAGNASFGTAVEVDGVRLSNNAGLSELSGVGTRSIAVENVESIEVITGVPSAEYGDLNAGMVKVNTKKGRTPLNLTFSVNPRTYQVSVGKGIDLQNNRGVLNLSGEWARATQKIVSPYTSYTRRNVSATYTNTFASKLRFEIGGSANIGGMDSKDDPDANAGNWSKGRDNLFRANTSLSWMVGASWITSLRLEASASYADNLLRTHTYYSSATTQPAIHSEKEGYQVADVLPLSYHADQVVDSKELDVAAALKYDWTRSFGKVKNRIKAGVQFKSSGNRGAGEYYEDPSLSPNGYRPRPYSQYPFMNNLSEYIEDQITVPVGSTKLDVTAGVRFEQVFIKDTKYDGINSLSPRFNVKWAFSDHVTLRGGWGVSEKLPSFWVLYPKQEYRDILTDASTQGTTSLYEYYTIPYKLRYNPDLLWQRNYNSEIGLDLTFGEWSVNLVGFYNITRNPYQYLNSYRPFTYLNHQSGVLDHTFVKTTTQSNGKPVYRSGAELTVDFPEIKPIRTSFRLDAAYGYSSYVDDILAAWYPTGVSHPDSQHHQGESYPYYGVYARGSSTSTVNGKITHNLDANLTSITHIPQARLVITCRVEASILRRSRNLSDVDGREYAFNINETSSTPTGGSIYDGNSYAAIWPVCYYDMYGQRHDFTAAEAADAAFSNLIIKTGNAYTFAQDGYGLYLSANLSITKEVGDHVSLSFFANNFTASRPAVTSMATGVSAIFTPTFYYGLTCRIKL